jgi:hypothetical protein
MLDAAWIATVEKALRQARQQIQLLVGLAQEQCPTIRTDRASIKTGYDLP